MDKSAVDPMLGQGVTERRRLETVPRPVKEKLGCFADNSVSRNAPAGINRRREGVMAKSSSAFKAIASRLARGSARGRTLRAIKARLAGLVDAVSDWLAPGWAGPELQPVRIRGDRGRGRSRS